MICYKVKLVKGLKKAMTLVAGEKKCFVLGGFMYTHTEILEITNQCANHSVSSLTFAMTSLIKRSSKRIVFK